MQVVVTQTFFDLSAICHVNCIIVGQRTMCYLLFQHHLLASCLSLFDDQRRIGRRNAEVCRRSACLSDLFYRTTNTSFLTSACENE